MDPLADWLGANDLSQLETLFVENEVDLATLHVLTDADLKELGIPFGPRKRLVHALAHDTVADTPVQPAVPRSPQPASDRSERRQLTVMFCDMVDYTGIAGSLDPEVLQAIIADYESTCAACVDRYEGHVFQRLGDGIVAFFGYPPANEAEAERAIHAARAIIDALRTLDVPAIGRLHARIGIASGEVVVSPGDGGAVGETMNVASRLQDRSEPDSIVVSESVRRLAGSVFDYEDLGLMTLKGITRPARAYRIAGVRAVATRFEAASEGTLTPLVARDQEIGLLTERFQSAQDGDGQVVLLSGEPGIGKSRVLNTLHGSLETRGVDALRFQCSPYHLHSAFYPIIDNLERATALDRSAPPDDGLDKLEAFMIERNGCRREDLPLIASLLSIPFEGRYGPLSLRPHRLKEETLRALVDLASACAVARPSVMLFEDLHWADNTTLDVLDLLIDQMSDLPLLAVFTYRPEFEPRWLGHGHVTAINLAKLTRSQCNRLVMRITHGKAIPPSLMEQIVDRTDGVPLFIEEFTKSVLESGDLRDAGDHYDFAGEGSSVSVPPTLRDLLMARLDQEVGVMEIAQIGAAIGRSFSYELLSAIAPVTPDVLIERLDRLQATGLAFRRGKIPSAQFTFKHALVQDAAYESMLKSRRQDLHGKIAHVLEELFHVTAETEPERLAQHFTAAKQETLAIPYWRRAGERAMQRFAMAEALEHLRRGLELISGLPAGPDRDALDLELRRLLGPTVVALKGWAAPEVVRILEPAWTLAQSLNHRESFIPVLHGLWVNALTEGRLVQAKAWAERMLSVATANDDEDLLLCGHRAAMASHFWLGELTEAKQQGDAVRKLYDFERHWRIATLTNSDPLSGDGTYRSQYLWMLGYPDEALRIADENHTHAVRRGHPFDEALALTLGSAVYDFCHQPSTLVANADKAIEVGREHGIPVMADVLPEITKGIGWLRAGREHESVSQLREGIRRLKETGQVIWGPYLRAVLAEAFTRDGDPAAGLELVNEALADAEARSERPHYAEMLRIKAEVLRALGRDDEAIEILKGAIDSARTQSAKSWELRAATTLADVLADRDACDQARDILKPVYDWFTQGHATRDLLAAREMLDRLES